MKNGSVFCFLPSFKRKLLIYVWSLFKGNSRTQHDMLANKISGGPGAASSLSHHCLFLSDACQRHVFYQGGLHQLWGNSFPPPSPSHTCNVKNKTVLVFKDEFPFKLSSITTLHGRCQQIVHNSVLVSDSIELMQTAWEPQRFSEAYWCSLYCMPTMTSHSRHSCREFWMHWDKTWQSL